MAIKMTIPFDSKSIEDEYGHRERKIQEKFFVKVNGVIADSFTRWIFPSQKTVFYGGEELLIRGQGFDRYVEV